MNKKPNIRNKTKVGGILVFLYSLGFLLYYIGNQKNDFLSFFVVIMFGVNIIWYLFFYSDYFYKKMKIFKIIMLFKILFFMFLNIFQTFEQFKNLENNVVIIYIILVVLEIIITLYIDDKIYKKYNHLY